MRSLKNKLTEQKKQRSFHPYPPPACAFEDGACVGTDDPTKVDLQGHCALLRGKCSPSYQHTVPVELVDAMIKSYISRFDTLTVGVYDSLKQTFKLIEDSEADLVRAGAAPTRNIAKLMKWQQLYLEMESEMERRKKELEIPDWVNRNDDGTFQLSQQSKYLRAAQDEEVARRSARDFNPYTRPLYPHYFP